MNSIIILTSYFVASWTICALLHKGDSILLKNNEHNAHKLIFLTLPPLILGFYFIALRPFDSGGDTITYLASYNRLSSPITATLDTGFGTELLFWPVQALMKPFLDERGWLIANYFIILLLTYFAYKKATDKTPISPLLFSLVFMTFFAVYAGNAMRQIYSIPLGLLAFHYCYQKNYSRFVIFAALSIAFHWSAVIILASPLFTRLPNKKSYYIGIPIAALACSSLIGPFVELVTSLTGLDWLSDKSNLYLKGGRVSHIEAVWKTVNFWLCVIIYLSLVFTNAISDEKHQNISKFLLMFFSLMLFAVTNADVSERYMVWFLFLVPLAVAVIFSKIKITSALKNQFLLILFMLMAALVFTRESAMATLGIS